MNSLDLVNDDDQGGGAVLIRIHVPDLNIHKCLQFYRQDFVWDVKQQCLASLPKELKESFNYGLFAPPCNGKAGKFLDEERPLSDYPFSGPVGYLELRYKRRLYKTNFDEKTLKSLHTKSNLKRFLEYVGSANTEKVAKMCGKGLDPNFHCSETGETPLSMVAVMKKPSKLLLALVNGGALLDYRTKDGSTSMHRAVEARSLEGVKTLLDLGGSPNYKDAKGLTPLYLSVQPSTDPALTQALLHDHAYLGAQDQQGWHETHQACRNGLIHHLEHLLFYGADMNARNASGNTPLHVCGVNNQEPCARLLLFRGADKEALNFANQTAYQVAVIAGNMDLAQTIQQYKQQDVVPFRETPSYNPKRRGIITRSLSSCVLFNGSIPSHNRRSVISLPPFFPPPSPSTSHRSTPPYSSDSSSISESSSNNNHNYSEDSSNYSSENSSTPCSSQITDKSYDQSDITSDSSGVGTCNSGGSGSSYDATPTDNFIIHPGMMVVCVENYDNQLPKHLKLTEGDIIEVTASTDNGFLEGSLRGEMGLFPSSCVQEIRMQGYEVKKGGVKNLANGKGKHHPRLKKMYYTWGEPHTVILHRGQKGFGFILRGAKSDSPLMELQPSDRFPALQYLDDVDVNGVADRAGLHKGDFILAINGVDVSQSSHESVVDFIRKSGDLVSMTVIGLSLPANQDQATEKPGSPSSLTCEQGTPKPQQHFATLPRKHSGSNGPSVPSPPRRDPNTSLSVGRARAKSMVAALAELDGGVEIITVGKSSSAESVSGKPPIPSSTPSNGHTKTASIRSRPNSNRISSNEMQDIFNNSNNTHKIYASVSEMKRSKSGGKGKEASKLHKDFHSTPDLKDVVKNVDGTISVVRHSTEIMQDKKSLSQEGLNKLKANPRHSWACISQTPPDFFPRPPQPPPQSQKERIESEDDLGSSSYSSGEETTTPLPKPPLPIESEYRTIKPLRPIQSKTLPRRASTGCASAHEHQNIMNLVPPGQVIKVDVSKSSKDYGTLEGVKRDSSVMSSFKPTDSAKLYASPDDLRSIGYREGGIEVSPGHPGVNSLRKTQRSQSLPRGSEENKIKGDYAQPQNQNVVSNGVVVGDGSKKKEADNNFDPQKSLQEAKERLKPVLKNNSSSNNTNTSADGGKIRIEVKQSPRLSRKGEKTVTFEGENGGNAGNSNMSHSLSVEEFQKVKSSLKSSKSFPNDLKEGEEDTTTPPPPPPHSDQNYITNLPINPDDDSDEDSSDKTWIVKDKEEKEENGPIVRPQVMRNSAPGGTLTKNAVSLVKLPPPMEMESESEEKSPKTTPILKKTSIYGSAHVTGNTVGIQPQNSAPPNYHTLQPQRSKPMMSDEGMGNRQYNYATPNTHNAQPVRQAEKSIEESIKLIRMHVEALKQDFPSAAPTPTPTPPPMSQTPILAPPPEFSDARDTHESATRFNQGQAGQAQGQDVQNFNRASPLYRSISHTHSSATSMYSGYPTMTRQQYQQQQQYNIQQYPYHTQPQQQQQLKQQPPQPQQQQHVYHTLGRPMNTNAQSLLNAQQYNHYQTLKPANTTQQPNLYTHQHHPKCYYYQQTNTPASANNTQQQQQKYIPEKLHPVHRYTPDLYESTGPPRIVGAIPKKIPGVNDHYEIPHAHQQQLLQLQQQQNALAQQQQQHQQNSLGAQQRIVRREFRNKTLPDWTVTDTSDWLESLFMPEYKASFQQKGIDGKKLLRMDNATLLELGVKKLGHRMNIEKSLKRYLPQPKT